MADGDQQAVSSASRPAERVALLVPADLSGPSGGTIYDRAVCRSAMAAEVPLVERAVPGTWPHPSREHLRALADAIADETHVLVDGIIAGAAPAVVRGAVSAGIRVDVLFHSSVTGAGADQRAERSALTDAAQVICTGRWAEHWLRETYGIAAHVVEPGVDAALVAAGSSPRQLLMLGALGRVKNQLTAVRALGRLSAAGRDPDWRLVIAGPTSREPDAVEEIVSVVRHDLPPGAVDVLGPVDGAELDRLWHRTDLLLHPSLSETYGMVVAEALARGIPAIVARGTGAELTLQDAGRSLAGAVVDARDEMALAAEVNDWLGSAERRAAWATAARRRRDHRRSWDETAAALWGVLSR